MTERYFMGLDVTEEEALQTARFFLEKKEDLLRCVNGFEFLEERACKEVRESLEEFFEILGDEKMVVKTFVKN
ncbi:MAG: hypothetical protein IPJ40_20235 [Saprospirales bacterium]|nr:hypothetical protein [Saprospirales bacterium]